VREGRGGKGKETERVQDRKTGKRKRGMESRGRD